MANTNGGKVQVIVTANNASDVSAISPVDMEGESGRIYFLRNKDSEIPNQKIRPMNPVNFRRVETKVETMNTVLNKITNRIANGPPSLDVIGNVIKACPPCSREVIEKAERDLGFSLPIILKEIYNGVANGGFGPGYGIMGVDGGFTDDMGETVVSLYLSYRESDPEDPSWAWPYGWLPICHWGCIVYTVVDCVNPQSPVLFVGVGDRDEGQPIDELAVESRPSLTEWLDAWLEGVNLWDEVFR